MKIDELDNLISDLSEEVETDSMCSGDSVLSLMSNAVDLLYRYRLAIHLSAHIGLVLDEAQKLCEAAVPTVEMIGDLRVKGMDLQNAARAFLAEKAAASHPTARPTPEQLATTAVNDYFTQEAGSVRTLEDYIALAIRKDRYGPGSNDENA